MDFVTVCFEKDLPQMTLQARSMDRFLSNFPVDNIIVVLNDSSGMQYLRDTVLPNYGNLKHKVLLLNHNDVVERITPCGFCKRKNKNCGYCYQQLLKLSATKYGKSDSVAILDAKIWLTKEWQTKDVFDNDKLRVSYETTNNDHWKNHRLNSWKYFNLEYRETPIVVNLAPFFLHKDIADILANDNNLLEYWNSNPSAEFFLIEAATIKKYHALEEKYWFSDTFVRSIWPFNFDQLDMDEYLKYFIDPQDRTLCSGLHRLCYNRLSNKNIQELIKHYEDLQLLTAEETVDLITQMRALNP